MEKWVVRDFADYLQVVFAAMDLLKGENENSCPNHR